MSVEDLATVAIEASPVPPNFLGAARGLSCRSTANTPIGKAVWDHCNEGFGLDVFEGSGKGQWFDMDRSYCKLCDEPFNHFGNHISDRDHVCIGFFLFVLAHYPRPWGGDRINADGSCTPYDPAAASMAAAALRSSNARSKRASLVGSKSMSKKKKSGAMRSSSATELDASSGQLRERALASSSLQAGTLAVHAAAAREYPSLFRNATTIFSSQDHLHTVDDAVRRASLTALLEVLARPEFGVNLVFSGQANSGLGMSGERMMKNTMSRMCATMFPPSAAGVHTQFTHKCWGRTNLDRFYDAIGFDRLTKLCGGKPLQDKNVRAFYLRAYFWEILAARDTARCRSDVMAVLIEKAVIAMAFELVYLMAMQYMIRAQDACRRLGYPGTDQLHLLGSL